MKKENVYLILPGCDDTNRGDQALIWETVEMARTAGFDGKYYMVSTKEKSRQSAKIGIQNIEQILPHPSSHFKNKNNISYGKILKLQWAFASIFDSVKALLLFSAFGRKMALRFASTQIKKSLEVYMNAKAAFVKGGGFLHSYGGFASTYTVFYNLYHIILAQRMGIKVYVMPNSYGPFKGPGSAWLIKNVLRKCKIVTARESISVSSLKTIGITCLQYPDLAFYLEMDTKLNREQSIKINNIPFGKKKCVGITMRPYRFPGMKNPTEAYDNYKKTFCKFIKWLNNEEYFPVLIEHTYSDTEHERDISCINDVVKMIGVDCEYAVFSDLSLNCRQLKYLYSKFDFLIGTRFHSVIFSIASEVPAIAITYGGNKGQGIMKDIGIGKYAIPITEMNFNCLVKSFKMLSEEKDDVKQKIQSYLSRLSQEKDSLIEQMKG